MKLEAPHRVSNSTMRKESVILLLSGSLSRADLDQTGSPAWSAAGRTGGVQTGRGCPCVGRRTPVRAGGASERQPSLGGYLRERRQRRIHIHRADEAHC